MKRFLEIEEITNEQVVIKVKDRTLLEVAQTPSLSNDVKYITVTRGAKHIMTLIKESGKTFSFHWGDGGYTLISEELELLKREVVNFINNNNILFDANTDVTNGAKLYFNSSFDSWQVSHDNDHKRWFKTKDEAVEYLEYFNMNKVFEEPNPYVKVVEYYEVNA